MKNSPYVRAALAHAALEHSPPLIRKSLLEESDFREEYSFAADAVLSFGDSAVSVQRSGLLDAVRKLFSDASEMEVTDTEGQKWDLKNISGEGEPPSFALSRGKQRLILPDFSALSSDRSERLSSLEEAASEVNLPTSARDVWLNVLAERPLADDQLVAFHSEFRDTPVEKARSIRSEVVSGQSTISSLVPPSRRYFERLVGVYDGSASVGDYAAGSGKALFHQLSAWRPYDGFLFSLFLSSHSSLTSEINVDLLSSEELLRAYEFLEEHGDRISQLGAIEVGLRILSARPEIDAVLTRLIEQIRDDDVEGTATGFQLLSALFVLVDGELSRARLFAADPPFYRRLAALAQAALIHRQLVNSAVDIDRFCEWAINSRGQLYYLQSLTDLRTEPRWSPDLASASQLKAECFGRIMIAAKNYEGNIKASDMRALVLGTDPGSLHSLSSFPHPYLPGPLEGAEDSQNMPPAEIAEAIETQLSSDEVGPASFIALVNSSLIFRIDSDQAALAAKALKLASYRLANIEDRSQLVTILNGLATVAAITRSHELADELRILVRRYRRDAEYALSLEEAMRIGIVAAASHPDLKEWRAFAGDWLTELAFQDLEDDEGQVLHSHLKWLCHVVPELWVTCGRSDAALHAFKGR